MIQLTCTNCKARLEMDDAFAGGVCRCRYCGTIQTVPSHLKRSGGATRAKVSKPKAAKALYQQPARPDASETGLEDLADAVCSSGISSGGLSGGSSGHLPRVRQETIAPPRRMTPKRVALVAGVSVAAVALLVAGLWLAFSGGETKPARPQMAGVSPEKPTPFRGAGSASPTGMQPNFFGVPLRETSVIYVVDRGSATADVFPDLKEACVRSIESLAEAQRFQLIFWNNGAQQAFPQSGLAPATAANVEAARRLLEDISAYGQSDPRGALAAAFAANPEAIVLATAASKASQLDSAFLAALDSVRKASRARVYAFAVGPGDAGTALAAAAARTGGQFHRVDPTTLKQYLHD